jgi:hypothetical protein
MDVQHETSIPLRWKNETIERSRPKAPIDDIVGDCGAGQAKQDYGE